MYWMATRIIDVIEQREKMKMGGVVQLEMNGEEINIYIAQDVIHIDTIRHALKLEANASVVLSIMLNGTKVHCCYIPPHFHLPNGWETLKFIVRTDKKPEKLVEKSRTEEDQSIIKDITWFQSLQKYALYYEDSSNLKHCVTPISKNLVATHAFKGCFESSEESGEAPIIIRSSVDPNYQIPAKIVGLDEDIGMVVLQSIDEDFGEDDVPKADATLHKKYLMLGSSNETPIVGHIIGFVAHGDQTRTYGSSKYSKKYLGSGVWNQSGQLIGMQIRENFVCTPMEEQTKFIPIEIIQKKANEWLESSSPCFNRGHKCTPNYCWCGPKYIYSGFTVNVQLPSGKMSQVSYSHCSPSQYLMPPTYSRSANSQYPDLIAQRLYSYCDPSELPMIPSYTPT